MAEELKPCPFCGGEARIQHDRIEPCRNSENGDLITHWSVYCPNCGTKKEGGITEYYFNNEEKLVIQSDNFNGRKKAIEAWNRRANNSRSYCQ